MKSGLASNPVSLAPNAILRTELINMAPLFPIHVWKESVHAMDLGIPGQWGDSKRNLVYTGDVSSERSNVKAKFEKLIIVLVFFTAYFGILYHPTLPVFINEFNTVDGSIYASRFIDVCTALVLFFSVVFILVPKYLEKSRMLPFIALSVVIIVFLSLLEYQLHRVILHLFNLPTGPDEISDKMMTFYRRKSYDFPILPINIAIYILGILYGISRDWIRKYRQESKIVQEKMRADIDLLRSQINPHFFFNALNNIFAITQRNQDEEAGQAIMKLSGLMRYMIYDSDVAEISLIREIEHIANYLEVARLRFGKDERPDIRMNTEGDFQKDKIAPLLLVPFVENALKHGIGSKGEGYMHLHVRQKDGRLHFLVENPVLEKAESLKKHSGIGLENVRKRLQLLYPDRHQLDISTSNGKFKVELILRLEA